eukprot:10039716-Heterocapsa_arctica.AAC.1
MFVLAVISFVLQGFNVRYQRSFYLSRVLMYTDTSRPSKRPPNVWPLSHYQWLSSICCLIEEVFDPHRAYPARMLIIC